MGQQVRVKLQRRHASFVRSAAQSTGTSNSDVVQAAVTAAEDHLLHLKHLRRMSQLGHLISLMQGAVRHDATSWVEVSDVDTVQLRELIMELTGIRLSSTAVMTNAVTWWAGTPVTTRRHGGPVPVAV